MTEHPLICNSQVVRNILAGRQTQDRRPITKRYFRAGKGAVYERDWPLVGQIEQRQGVWRAYLKKFPGISIGEVESPFGKPGDVLVVREAWWAVEVTDIGIQYCVFDDEIIDGIPTPKELRLLDRQTWQYGRHPSIHMPMKHSRLRLTVKRVWVERVRSISETDCLCEGIRLKTSSGTGLLDHSSSYSQFQALWNSIYGPDAWDRNDWVFACEFKEYPGQ